MGCGFGGMEGGEGGKREGGKEKKGKGEREVYWVYWGTGKGVCRGVVGLFKNIFKEGTGRRGFFFLAVQLTSDGPRRHQQQK